MNDITSRTSLAFLGILLILVSIGSSAQTQTSKPYCVAITATKDNEAIRAMKSSTETALVLSGGKLKSFVAKSDCATIMDGYIMYMDAIPLKLSDGTDLGYASSYTIVGPRIESVDGWMIMQQMNVVSKDTLSADIDRAMREAVAAILKNVAILPAR